MRSFASTRAEAESLELIEVPGGRRAIGMTLSSDMSVRISGDVTSLLPPDPLRCTIQILVRGTVVADAHGVPANGVGRVTKSLCEAIREQRSLVSPSDVIVAYDQAIRADPEDMAAALQRVAADKGGPVWQEVLDLADKLGFDLEGHHGQGRNLLWAALEEYQQRLRLESSPNWAR